MAATAEGDESSLETRIETISEMLKAEKVDGGSIVGVEVTNDRFIRNFLARNASAIPESSFVVNRLKRVPLPEE